MPTPLRLDGILAKIESQYGTDPTPTVADDGVRVSDRVWNNLRPERAFPNLRETTASGSLITSPPALPQGGMVSMTFGVEFIGAGSAYAAGNLPVMDPLLRACGLTRTDDFTGGTENVEYAPASTGHASCTIWAYAATKLYKVVGCRGTFRWPINPGQLSPLLFEMQGILSADPTEVSLPAITYNAAVPPAAVNMSLQIAGAWTPNFQVAELALGAQVQRQDSGNATNGIREFAIPAFDPRFTMTAETVPLTTYNPGSAVTARTSQAIAGTLGSAQYNKGDIVVAASYLLNDPDPAVFNDFTAWALEYKLQDLILRFD
jgi:hypothetical protein